MKRLDRKWREKRRKVRAIWGPQESEFSPYRAQMIWHLPSAWLNEILCFHWETCKALYALVLTCLLGLLSIHLTDFLCTPWPFSAMEWILLFDSYMPLHIEGCLQCKNDIGKSDLNLSKAPIIIRLLNLMHTTSVHIFVMCKVEKIALTGSSG